MVTMTAMIQQEQQERRCRRRRRQRQGKQLNGGRTTARSFLVVATTVAIMTVAALTTAAATTTTGGATAAVRPDRRRSNVGQQQSVRNRRPTTRGVRQAGHNSNSNSNSNNSNNRNMQEIGDGGDGSFIQNNFFANRDPKDEDGSVAFFNNNDNHGSFGGGNLLQGGGGQQFDDGTVSSNNFGLTGQRFSRNRVSGGNGSLFRQATNNGKGKKGGKKKCKGRKGKKASESPSVAPSFSPSFSPSLSPSESPSLSGAPSFQPSLSPSVEPSLSVSPSFAPSSAPSVEPSLSFTPSVLPSLTPSGAPSRSSKKGKKSGKKSSKKSDGKGKSGKGKGKDGKGKGKDGKGKGKGSSSWDGNDDDWMWCDDDDDDYDNIQDICQNCVCFNGQCACNCDQGIIGQLPSECQDTCVCPSGSTTCTCDCYDDNWNGGGGNPSGPSGSGPSGSGPPSTWNSNPPAQSPSASGSNSPTEDYWPGQRYCNFMWQYNEGRGYDQSLEQTGDPTYTFGAGMEVQIDTSSRSSSDLEYVLNSAMRNPPALHTAYCEWEAERSFENAMLFLSTEGTRNLRELQDNAVVQVLMETWDDTGSNRCNGNQARQNAQGGGDCPWIMVTNVLNVWTRGNVDAETLKQRLAFALELYMGKLVTDIDWVTGVTEGPLVEETGNGNGNGNGGNGGGDSNAIEEMELSQSKSKAGPYIGAAAGTLAFILLLILLVRRRRNRADDEMSSHLKLDDDDDTFFQDVGSEGSPNPEYLGREAHVVGEADSIYSHWTGYTGKKAGDFNADKGTTTDVHHCSSATCEICERRRQMGVDFVSARTASLTFPPTLPSDASRDYILEDTVEL